MLKCSFCGKSEDDVDYLVTSGNGANICDKCILLSLSSLCEYEHFQKKFARYIINGLKKNIVNLDILK